MSGKQCGLMLGVTIIVSFAGGAVSSFFFTALTVQASSSCAAPRPNVVTVPPGGLIFKTHQGKTVARMEDDPAGARFGLYNGAGEAVVIMGVHPDGGGFAIYSGEGKPLGSMAATPRGGVLGLFSKEEKILWKAP